MDKVALSPKTLGRATALRKYSPEGLSPDQLGLYQRAVERAHTANGPPALGQFLRGHDSITRQRSGDADYIRRQLLNMSGVPQNPLRSATRGAKRDFHSPEERKVVRDAQQFARFEGLESAFGKAWPKTAESRMSDMKTIIDDIIKGAEQNSFGRPVNVQVSQGMTPIKVAEYAGALQALGERGYSVKEAAEYLGLTEAQVQDIVARVR